MKTAFITGACGDIGEKITERLIKDGYFVVGQYRNDERAAKNLKEKFAGYFFPVKADLTQEKDVKSAVEYFYGNFPRADVFIHCAGTELYKLAQETSVKEWDDVFAVNVKSAFSIARELIPPMVKVKSGRIVFITSVWGKVGASMESVYSASKAALKTFAVSLAKELGPSGITVNCVCPGVIDTKMNKRFDEAEIGALIDATPLKRLGTPADVAELCGFLVGDKAGFITGQEITVDGGFSS